MTTRTMLMGAALAVSALLGATAATAQSSGAVSVDVTIRADQPGATIDPNVYGQFAEHLGTGIYEGVWVGEDSDIPNTSGYRDDVVAALRDLQVPVVRWPGGCFADEYHWRDGIGPRDQRPVRVNTHWGGVAEDNSFGTHEFMAFADMIGAKVYINGNLGSGTPYEMAEWLEYLTSNTQSSVANERRANGREEPWEVHYWGIGNEMWGCGGHMRPEFYVDLYRQYATFLKAPPGHRPEMIASGGNDDNTEWTEALSAGITRDITAITHHYYTTPTGVWEQKGNATGYGEDQWISTLRNTMRIDDFIRENVEILDRNDPQNRIGFYIDEWGTWYDTTPGHEPGFLWQQNTIRDGLVAALNFNIFHEHAERVRMTNIAQMVNVLQAMILTDGPRMTLTPTYHVFHMYRPFQGATHLPTEITTPQYALGDVTVPAVHVSAARGEDGRIHLALVNLDPNREAVVNASVAGSAVAGATGRVLTADALDAHNTVDAPTAVTPSDYSASRQGDNLALRLPPKSVVVVALD